MGALSGPSNVSTNALPVSGLHPKNCERSSIDVLGNCTNCSVTRERSLPVVMLAKLGAAVPVFYQNEG